MTLSLLGFAGAILIHSFKISLWIKANHQSDGKMTIYLCIIQSFCVFYILHTHKHAVEWYSSYLDETLAVSQSSLLAGSASPPSLPFSQLYRSIDIQSSWLMFQSPGIKNEPEGDRSPLLWRIQFLKMALHIVNGKQTTIKWEQMKRINVKSAFWNPYTV